MTTRKRKPSTSAEPAPPQGYRRVPRYRTFTCDLFEVPEGSPPLEITIQSNLTIAQLEAIPSGKTAKTDGVLQAMAPYVTGWNLLAENTETGAWEPCPPPAEAGWEVFKLLDTTESLWVIGKVRWGEYSTDDARKKGATPAGSTPGPQSASDSGNGSAPAKSDG